MKKLFGVILVIALSCTYLFSPLIQAYAFTWNKERKTTLSADMNGDGRKDRIVLKQSGFVKVKKDEAPFDDYYKKLTVYVNGEKLRVLKDDHYGFEYQLLKLRNKRTLLFVHMSFFDADGPCYVFDYRNGKLVKLIDLVDRRTKGKHYRYVDSIKVKGNTLYVKKENFDMDKGTVVYEYRKGKLIRK